MKFLYQVFDLYYVFFFRTINKAKMQLIYQIQIYCIMGGLGSVYANIFFWSSFIVTKSSNQNLNKCAVSFKQTVIDVTVITCIIGTKNCAK